jgi:hypothetical protein
VARKAKRAATKGRKAARGASRSRAGKARKPAPAGGRSALAAAVRVLADRREIEDGIICYGHALDSRDYARLRD